MSSPKVAIIIYTLYGHIAKRTSDVYSTVFAILTFICAYSGRGCEGGC